MKPIDVIKKLGVRKMSPSQNFPKVFISYSHQDSKYLKRLLVHLVTLERNKMIDIWSDTKIVPGANWRSEIKQAIEVAEVAILLVSADFLASQFIAENELPPLLAAAETRGTIIIPIILSPCGFEYSPLSQFQAINSPSKPLVKMKSYEREELWDKVAKTIRDTITNQKNEDLNKTQTSSKQSFFVSYGPFPSKATVKTERQFIMLEARSGGIESYMLDIVREVLEDIEVISRRFPKEEFGINEFLMFRGAWFDDKHGAVILFIDLIHDASVQPSLSEEQIKIAFHDGFAWYGNQGIDVIVRIIKEITYSDGFFPTSSEYYNGFPWF